MRTSEHRRLKPAWPLKQPPTVKGLPKERLPNSLSWQTFETAPASKPHSEEGGAVWVAEHAGEEKTWHCAACRKALSGNRWRLVVPVDERGQGLLLDFTVGLMIFLVAWFYLGSQFDSKLAAASKENETGIMKLRADFALDTLVKTRGGPQDWETGDINSLVFPGLAQRDRELSQAKLSAFSNMSSGYSQLKDRMGIGEYDFFFSYKGGADVNAGLEPQGNATIVAVQRAVSYNGNIGTATLKVYRLEN